MQPPDHTNLDLDLLREQLSGGRLRTARLIVNSLHAGELARMLESLPRPQRALVWDMVEQESEGDVLVELAEEIRDDLIRGMPIDELIVATEGMQLDDLADLLGDLPETVTSEVVQSLDKQDRERLETVLAYDKDSAGGLMNVDVVTIRPDVTLGVVLRFLRARGEIPEGTDTLFVVNRRNESIG